MKEEPKGTIRGSKGIVITNPSEKDPDKAGRDRRNRAIANALSGIFPTGHAYFGDPKAYLEGGEVGGHHGAYGAGNPDVGYMPEMLPMVERGKVPTVMRVMEKATQMAAKEKKNLVGGIYCNQLGCQPEEALAPENPRNPEMRKLGQRRNYQNIVDTTRGLPPGFVLVAPSNRTTGISDANPFGTQEEVIAYRPGKDPKVLGVKGKRQSYKELLKQAREVADRELKEDQMKLGGFGSLVKYLK